MLAHAFDPITDHPKQKAWLDEHTDQLFKMPDLIRGLIDTAMGTRVIPLHMVDSGLTLPAYRVGAGDKETPQESAVSASSKEISNPPVSSSGDGVGRESEGTPRKPLLKQVPDELAQHHELIDEFWRVKKGSKSQTAWNLLMTELKKIQAAYNDDRLNEQLQLAINGLWAGINLRNLQRFETPKEKAAKDESKHPQQFSEAERQRYDEERAARIEELAEPW